MSRRVIVVDDPITKVSMPVASRNETPTADPFVTRRFDPSSPTPPSTAGLRALPTVPGYRILDKLGEGGMGVVYRAWHESLGREVALKLVSTGPHRTSEDRLRFRREASTAARLSHPNIVPVFEVGETPGYALLSMALVSGGTLRSWQDGRPIPPRTAAKIALALASAVAHAHQQGILHRDLKPANILLAPSTGDCHDGVCVRPEAMPANPWQLFDRAGEDSDTALRLGFLPKIADFGLAKDINAPELTATGFAVGTPQYMAPEQMETGSSSTLSDVYQLGVVLFEMLAGRAPFVAHSAGEVMKQVLTQEAPTPRLYAPGIPRDLEVIVGKCLERDPQRRYPSAQEFAADLMRFIARKPIKARPLCLPSRVWRWGKRNPSLAALLVVLALSSAGGAAASVAVWQSGRDERAALDQLAQRHQELLASNTRRDAEIERANKNLKIAREATRATLLELANNADLKHPRFIDLRRRLLDQAKPTFDQFIAQTSDDVDVIREQALICRQLGIMRAAIGDLPRANKRFDQALESYTKLEKLLPNDPIIDREVCDLLLLSARSRRNAGFADEGDRRVAEAMRRLEARHAAEPEDTETTLELARAELAFLHATSTAEQRSVGETHTRRALALVEEVLAKHPENQSAIHYHGRALRELGLRAFEAGRLSEAARSFDESVRIREQFVQRHPDDLEQKSALAETLLSYSKCVPGPAAVSLVERAIELGDAIHKEAPMLDTYTFQLATYHAQLCELRGGADGVRELTVAVELVERLHQKDKGQYRVSLRDVLVRRANLFQALRRPADESNDRDRAARVMQVLVPGGAK